MMQENSEDKIFQDLLSDYSAPVEDKGFSSYVMSNLPTATSTHKSLKRAIVGCAALVGGIFATMQIPAFWRYVNSMSLPKVDVPQMNLASIDTSTLGSSYTLAAAACMAMLCVWFASTLLFGDNM
ncbi:MAG: hypothetical protein COA69_02695 [Robiginitomaculum sp.]|nr:MAG: hypothetical protein COA69_02695 [Robiginitomaculum sp.]